MVKVLALNSYSSFPFNPVALPLRHMKNAIIPMSASPPIIEPTAIPAFAPEDSPPELPEALEVDGVAASPVAEAAGRPVDDAVELGALKSSLVTLKQGTWAVKSSVLMKV